MTNGPYDTMGSRIGRASCRTTDLNLKVTILHMTLTVK